jgi:hypothetical protein
MTVFQTGESRESFPLPQPLAATGQPTGPIGPAGAPPAWPDIADIADAPPIRVGFVSR